MNDRIRSKSRRGRPQSPNAKRARLDLRTETKIKEDARANLATVGFSDLSAFLQHCLVLLASGQAQNIVELHAPASIPLRALSNYFDDI